MGLVPKRLVDAVVAVVAVGTTIGLIVAVFAVSAGFSGCLAPNKLVVLAPNKLVAGCEGGAVVATVAALVAAFPNKLGAGAVVLELLLFANMELPMPVGGLPPNKPEVLLVGGGLLLFVAGAVLENKLVVGAVLAG